MSLFNISLSTRKHTTGSNWDYIATYDGRNVNGVHSRISDSEAKELAYYLILIQIIIIEHERGNKRAATIDWEKEILDDLAGQIRRFKMEGERQNNGDWVYRAMFDGKEVGTATNQNEATARNLAAREARGYIYYIHFVILYPEE
ncbi:hypothetical protein EW145_g3247 [Phellinidium pouzarii]|uniref:Uncharacterized protein n=1 Tax=Phellinidium pouzarii TaxID=167371 RepID=A0A4S4L869_9AGAM|nr:hypothetical protein EW145_g3247 [Phellinidium pouzarii]